MSIDIEELGGKAEVEQSEKAKGEPGNAVPVEPKEEVVSRRRRIRKRTLDFCAQPLVWGLFFCFFEGFFFFFLVVVVFCFCFCFLGLHPWHMEVPRLGFELEL